MEQNNRFPETELISPGKNLLGVEFRKDYISYLLGVIIPAAINFLTIPFFKRTLGSSDFGIYSFYFSILMIVNSSFSGGVTQSIVRLYIEYPERKIFFIQCLWLTFLVQFFVLLPLFIYIQLNLHILAFSIFFVISLLLSNIYTTLLAITQASRLSAYSAIAETIRTALMLGLSIILMNVFPSLFFLNAVFISISLSYGAGSLFLFIVNHLSAKEMLQYYDFGNTIKLGKDVLKYGGFLVAWFLFSFGISFANRFILAHFLGKEQIGDYTASFDILNKSITVLLAPVVISLFPLIVRSFAKGDMASVTRFIKKLTLIELGLMAVSLILFVMFGFRLLSAIIETPETSTYLFLDIQVILSSFLWQIAMLQHKLMELQKKTNYMFLFIFSAFLISITVDIILISNFGVAFSSMGFLAGGIVYLTCVLYYSKNHFFQLASEPNNI